MPLNINAAHKAYSQAVMSASAGAFARFRPFVSHNVIPAGTPGMKIGIPVKGVNPVMDFGETPSDTAGNFAAPRGTLATRRLEVQVDVSAKILGDTCTFIEQQEYPANWLNAEGVAQGETLANYLTALVGARIMAAATPAIQSLTLPADSATLAGAALAARIRRVLVETANAPAPSECVLCCDPLTYERILSGLFMLTNTTLAGTAQTADIGQLTGFRGVIEIPTLDAPYLFTPSGLTIAHRDPNISMLGEANAASRREVAVEPITGIRVLNTVRANGDTGSVAYSTTIMVGAEKLTPAVNLDTNNAAGKGKGVYQAFKVTTAAS